MGQYRKMTPAERASVAPARAVMKAITRRLRRHPRQSVGPRMLAVYGDAVRAQLPASFAYLTFAPDQRVTR